jgi:hypothetical protein
VPGDVMPLALGYDGVHGLVDVVEESPFRPLDTLMITFRLAELGAIARRDGQSAPEPPRPELRAWLDHGRAAPPAPVEATPAPVAQAAPGRHPRADFDALDEDFFAREADLFRVAEAESFDDLEPAPPGRKRRAKPRAKTRK